MKTKKNVLVFLLGLALLSSCTNTTEPRKTRIQIMHGWGGTKPVHEAVRGIYADFLRTNPNADISFITTPDSSVIINKATDMLAVDKMPNVVSTNGTAMFVKNAVKRNMALDLMPFVKADPEFRSSIDQSVFDMWTTPDGKLYTIPDALEVMGYWYNKEIFEKAGITSPPKTWEEFWECCEKINTTFGDDLTVFALEKEQLVSGFIPARIAGTSQQGMAFVSKQPDSFRSELFEAALDDVVKAYSYSKHITEIEDARQLFRSGKTAIYCNGVWEASEIDNDNLKDKLAYANYPTESGKSLSYFSPASGYVVYKSGDTNEEEVSIAFIKYLLAPEQQKRIAIETGQAPCNPKVDIQEIKKESPVFANAIWQAREADFHILSISSTWNGESIDVMKNVIINFCNGGMSKDELILLLEQTI